MSTYLVLTLAVLALVGFDKLNHQAKNINRKALRLANQKAYAMELQEALQEFQKQKSRPSL